ncbi:hypothetical protein [Calothrix sp. NIES-2100]
MSLVTLSSNDRRFAQSNEVAIAYSFTSIPDHNAYSAYITRSNA